LKQFAFLLLAVISGAGLRAHSQCPANVKSVPFRNSQQHQVIVQVSINHAAPSDFLLDTGTQMTVIDQSLAAELHLPAEGSANIAGVSVDGPTKFAEVDSLVVGDHFSANQRVLVFNMSKLRQAGFTIRGLLGQDFLSQFDVFIDNAHSVLCIDDTGALRAGMQGSR
jgi:predicted aspartyl protease